MQRDKDLGILITGATGLVGSHLLHHLKEAGFTNVKGLSREIPQNGSSNFLKGDLMDIVSLEDCLKNISLVIHCAALVSFNPRDKYLMDKTNVEGTANLVNACLNNNVKSIIYISSVAALGKPTVKSTLNVESTINETQQWNDSPLNSNYAKSKYQAECEVWRGEAEGLRVAVVNPSIVLGEGDWNQSSSKLFKYVWDENKFTTDGFINYVDVKDVTRAIDRIISLEKYGDKYILNGGKVSFSEFFEKIAKRFNKKAPAIKLNGFWINILWRIEYLRSIILGSDPLITKETSITSQSNYFFDNSKAVKELGFSFMPLDNSLDRICSFYLSKKN